MYDIELPKMLVVLASENLIGPRRSMNEYLFD